MNKFVKAFVIIIIGLLLSLGANNIFSHEENYITNTKVVEKINHNAQNIYFTFENDDTIYSFTEFENVTSEYILENINVGNTLIITTENNIGEFKYTLIRKMEKNDNVIYDSIEYYKIHNQNLKLIFIPSIIIITLFLAIISLIKFGTKNTINNFTIRASKTEFNIFVFFSLVGFIVPLMFSILYFSGNMPSNTYSFSYIFYIFLILGILGLIAFAKEKLVYDGEYYFIYSPIKKVRKINKLDIKSIVIDKVNKGKNNKSGVYNRNDERIFLFSFDLLYCLKNEFFTGSLIINDVKFVELELNDKGEIIEKEVKIQA